MTALHTYAADGGSSRTRKPNASQSAALRLPVGQAHDALLVRQIRAIDAWTATWTQRRQVASTTTSSQEMRLDVSRRLTVLRQVHEAVVDRTTLALAADVAPMPAAGPITAVLVHRHDWVLSWLGGALDECGVAVLACTDNWAEALGVVVAEQPDLLFTGDRLAMLHDNELLAEAALFAPFTLLFAQASDPTGERDLCSAGSHTVFPCWTSLTEVAGTLTAVAEHAALAGGYRAS